ncbi:hypothetical protein IE077_002650 [Cardiosporidium cionae]|uniref:Uncharacterized protein n=1 Tax=Cardiosporidium cionae TaxID=476202 RepID=A0ABQ7JFW5_9APIC|nr:hypothetical protein IE077_002650 [Cardiosporidium cionae]|eukprot:KAF8822780.1 hypothetical protein IE077_002650 [Cardiosporidium cionae]
MPSGGHRGALFPISGKISSRLASGRRKPGLYHAVVADLFFPRCGYTHSLNESPLPDGSTRRRQLGQDRVFRLQRKGEEAIHYKLNEPQFLLPVNYASSPKIQKYLLNTLSHTHRSSNQRGIGSPSTFNSSQQYVFEASPAMESPQVPLHLKRQFEKLRDENNDPFYFEAVGSAFAWKERIIPLHKLAIEVDIWRNVPERKATIADTNPFPFVDENVSLIRPLPRNEILYVRSNHRPNCRRNPIWMARQKYLFKQKMPFFLRQRILREEAKPPVEDA